MEFNEIAAPLALHKFIECYWHIKDLEATPHGIQKIIPDGRPEIIFHFGDPYQIKIGSNWYTQARALVAGQFRFHFLLRNAGAVNMLGIKFRPWGLGLLYPFSMKKLVNQVHPLDQYANIQFPDFDVSQQSVEEVVLELNAVLEARVKAFEDQTEVISALQEIQIKNGLLKISDLCQDQGIAERRLERFCLKTVGISPKFLARIFRMNYIFKLMKEKNRSWTDLAFESGFFDQSHFIKNFKEFTGEDPSNYLFNAETMANFFVKR